MPIDLTQDSAATSVPDGFVGRSVLRAEDPRFLTGAGCYVDDLRRDGMCHAAVVRSPHAHARIRVIDVTGALACPGVRGVLTAVDLGELGGEIPLRLAPLPGFERCLQPVIARDRVRYAGEPVAVVIADDRYAAEDAAARVAVEYEPLEAVVDAHRAMAGGTVLHEAMPDNVATRYVVSRGDPDAAFAGAEYRRTERFRCHRHSAMPMETRGLVAEWSASARRMTVWGATKVPFFNRAVLARLLRLSPDDVELVELDVGGSFGVRGEFYPEDFLIPFAAMRIGHPVKWIETRREHLLAANHSREIECELEIAARRDGTILGLRARLVADMGAYIRTNGGVVPAKAAQFLAGPYRIDSVACEVSAVVTNKTPTATYRGPGRFEANFFRERLIDLMAADLALDPADVRLEEPLDTGGPTLRARPHGALRGAERVRHGRLWRRAAPRARCDRLPGDRAAQRGTRRRPPPWRRHRLLRRVERRRSLRDRPRRPPVSRPGRALHRLRVVGTGHRDRAGANPRRRARRADRVGARRPRHHELRPRRLRHVSQPRRGRGRQRRRRRGARRWRISSSRSPPCGPGSIRPISSYGAATCTGAAPRRAARARAGRARDRASPEAAAAREAVGQFRPAKLTYTYGAQIAHVAVDVETGAVELLRLVAVEDVGRAINPMLVHGQALGAAVQGLGGALMERLVYDDGGQLVTGTFTDYAMPTADAFPHTPMTPVATLATCSAEGALFCSSFSIRSWSRSATYRPT